MARPRFLVDEDTTQDLIAALRRVEPTMDLVRVGDQGAPPRATLDPDLLIAAQSLGRVLISQDRSTMPPALVAHFGAGLHTAGVILLRKGFPGAGSCRRS